MLVAAFISTQLHFNGLKNGLDSQWWIVFKDQLPIWMLWSLLTPVLIHFSNEFALNKRGLSKTIGLYLLMALPFLLLVSNLSLVYLFLTHGYLDLSNTSYTEYSPYLYSRLANDALIYTFIVGLILTMQAYRLRKQQELEMVQMQLRNDQLKKHLTQSQLQALKLQLNPHFIFNTLHTISSLTLIGENKTSAGVTTRLGDFLRRTLDYEEEQLVSLRKELEFFDLYLDIESVRFKDRLKINKEIPEALMGLKVPNLILQPLVENAIKHGLSRKKDAGLIELTIEKRDDQLIISLFNEGPMVKQSIAPGIGLSNVKERLDRMYGEQAGFELSNDASGKGVYCILTIPLVATAFE